jgi:hypothetical protein
LSQAPTWAEICERLRRYFKLNQYRIFSKLDTLNPAC